MRVAKILGALLVTLVASPSRADHVLIGKLVSAGASVNNSDTATPFTLEKGRVDVRCDAAVHIITGTADTLTATTDAWKIAEADKVYPLDPRKNMDYVAIIPVSGSATCWVYTVYLWP